MRGSHDKDTSTQYPHYGSWFAGERRREYTMKCTPPVSGIPVHRDFGKGSSDIIRRGQPESVAYSGRVKTQKQENFI